MRREFASSKVDEEEVRRRKFVKKARNRSCNEEKFRREGGPSLGRISADDVVASKIIFA
jgi:hypothetical protein